jgi:hypothetical protein
VPVPLLLQLRSDHRARRLHHRRRIDSPLFLEHPAPFGEYFEAAIIHDYLYSPHNRRFTRAQADAIFKEAMFNVGIGWLKRETIYRAVRALGWTAFKGNPPP